MVRGDLIYPSAMQVPGVLAYQTTNLDHSTAERSFSQDCNELSIGPSQVDGVL